jgi:hypothetical protein
MKTIVAKYASDCKGCGGEVKKGDRVKWEKGRGVYHLSCAPSHDPKADREYWEGRAEANRYIAEKAIYGEALADKFAAMDEWNRYWKHGEDY